MSFNLKLSCLARRVGLFCGALGVSVSLLVTSLAAQRKPTPKPSPGTKSAPVSPPDAKPDATKETEPQPPVLWCDAGFARALIEQQLNDTKKIFDSEHRIQTLVIIADAIWAAEPARARDAYRQAFDLSLARFDDIGRGTEVISAGILVGGKDWRYDVVRSIYKHDAKWAQELTQIILANEMKRAEEKPAETNRSSRSRDGSPGEQLLSVASNLLPNAQILRITEL